MNNRLSVLILSLVVIAITSTTGHPQKGRERFDPSGTFWIIGEAPSGFSDFSAINLNARRLRWLPSSGLQLNNGRTFRFQQLVVKRERLAFTTTQVRGVSYSFSGRFLKVGVFSETDLEEQSPDLEGQLTKIAAGKKVYEAKITLG